MEKFKEIEIKDMIYTISSYGRVFGKRGELKQRLNRDGYLEVTIGKTENRTCAREIGRASCRERVSEAV